MPATHDPVSVHPRQRCCVAERRRRLSIRDARRDILRGQNVQQDFTCIPAYVPPRDETVFKVCTDGRVLLFAAALYNTVGRPQSAPERADCRDDIEFFFDPRHDHVGYVQCVIPAEGAAAWHHHLPYPEAQSTAYPLPRLLRHEWREDSFLNVVGRKDHFRWLFAWFAADELFEAGPVCGFNVCRSRASIREHASWNPAAGAGYRDASSLGHLRLRPASVTLAGAEARWSGNRLILRGSMAGPWRRPALTVLDPLGRPTAASIRCRGATWDAAASLPAPLAGRYRLAPLAAGKATIEPDALFVDRPPARRKPEFLLAMTVDYPDDILSNHYTPERLYDQFKLFADAGIRRISWIDYRLSDLIRSDRTFGATWNRQARMCRRFCGDDLAVQAIRAAHALGLEFHAIVKVFDQIRVPEIPAHPEWTLARNPAWARDPARPVQRLRFYSEAPLPALGARHIRLWASRDNRDYREVRGGFRVRQAVFTQPHQRWTPAGLENQKTGRRVWMLELSGLNLKADYAAVQIAHPQFRLTNRRFAAAAADDARGADASVEVSPSGNLESGFALTHSWVGWANASEPFLTSLEWAGAPLGLRLRKPDHVTAHLEPACAAGHAIWLDRIRALLQAGADGVDIRTLCHHLYLANWQDYAYAPAVLAAFRKTFGREPGPAPADAERIRRLRGEGFTSFLREAGKLARSRRRAFAMHFESGMEVEPALATRMQIHWDWRTWLDEGLVDELMLKFWTSQNPFIHDKLLPRARARGVPVMIGEQNQSLDHPRGIEMAPRVIRMARDAGFAGYNFYEAHTYTVMNSEGVPVFRGQFRHVLDAARNACRP